MRKVVAMLLKVHRRKNSDERYTGRTLLVKRDPRPIFQLWVFNQKAVKTSNSEREI
jgi:hypothetical protein